MVRITVVCALCEGGGEVHESEHRMRRCPDCHGEETLVMLAREIDPLTADCGSLRFASDLDWARYQGWLRVQSDADEAAE